MEAPFAGFIAATLRFASLYFALNQSVLLMPFPMGCPRALVDSPRFGYLSFATTPLGALVGSLASAPRSCASLFVLFSFMLVASM